MFEGCFELFLRAVLNNSFGKNMCLYPTADVCMCVATCMWFCLRAILNCFVGLICVCGCSKGCVCVIQWVIGCVLGLTDCEAGCILCLMAMTRHF